jgi:putative transposase
MTRACWLTLEEVCDVTGYSPAHVHRLAAQNKLRSRLSDTKSANGRYPRQYRAEDLPSDAQKKIFERELVRAAESAEAVYHEAALVPFPQTPQQPTLFSPAVAVSERERMLLNPEDRAVAQQRLDAIAPLLDWRRGDRRTFTLLSGEVVNNINALAAYVGSQQNPPVSRATIWNWVKRYSEGGFGALADCVRRDKGTSRFFTQYPDAAEYAQNKYLNERLPIRLVHDALCRDWPSLYNHGSQPPSYSTLRCFLAALPKPLTILSREGEEQFNNKTAPYLLTDFNSFNVMDYWESDHCWHDVFVRNDRFSTEKPNAAMRLWLTSFIDLRSRKIVGACWMPTPSSHTISSALRLGVETYGVPRAVHVDNGKDFQKLGKIGLSEDATGVLQRLGIEVHYALKYHAQSKLIESWHHTLHQRFDIRWAPFYAGFDSKHRPEICDRALEMHELWLKGKYPEPVLPTASEFIAAAQEWIREYNAEHKHSGRGMDGKTPDEVFGMGCPPESRQIPDPNVLAHLFWDRQPRKVSEGGCVQINNERYEPADVDSVAMLHQQIGRSIVVACDPANLGRAIALDQDGHILGRLISQPLIARGPVSQPDIRKSMRLRSQLLRAYKGYQERLLLRRIAAGDNSESDLLRARAAMLAAPAPQLSSHVADDSFAETAPAYVGDVAERIANRIRERS